MTIPMEATMAKVNQFLARRHRLLIGGKWVEARDGGMFDIEDPATGDIISHAASGEAADIDAAVKAARHALEDGPWATMPPSQRTKLLWNLADLIEANLVTGGRRLGECGYFVEPTVLAETRADMSVRREEIFGPVLCAMSFGDDELDLIAKEANDTEYGLAASIWTRDVSAAHKLAKKIKAGIVWVNTPGVQDPAVPFGGFKQSGLGREKGREGVEAYTEVKSVVVGL